MTLSFLAGQAKVQVMKSGWNRTRAAMFAVFFVTGTSGLIYEVIAARMLRLVMGNTTFAITSVLCAFMGGMAIGSVLGGRVAERRSDLLKVFAVLQAGIAAYFFFLPWLINMIAPLYGLIHRSFDLSFYSLSLIRFFFCGLILLIPCTMMGATLPMLSRMFSESPEQVGKSAGMLYAVNTIGGAVGAWISGFVLMPAIGVRASLWTACCLSSIAGAVAWSIKNQPTRSTIQNPESRTQHPALPIWPILLCYGLAGAAGLIYEIAWTRVLTLLIGSSVYAFSLMLTAFILGLGLGSLVMARWVGRLKKPLAALAIVEFSVGFSALVVLPFFDRLPFLVTRLIAHFSKTFSTLQAVEFGLILAIMLVPTMLMGTAFPIVGRIVATRTGTTGRSVGAVCGSNTAGCIIGAFLAGFWLIPSFGIERTIIIAVLINILIGCAFFASCRRLSIVTRFVVPILVVFTLGVIVRRIPSWDLSKMTFGPYVQARKLSEITIDSEKSMEELASQHGILYHEEGVSVTVTVKDGGESGRVILVNGKPDASSSGDMPTQIMIAQLPLLLHNDPESALVVGLASGISLGSASLHGLKTLDCVEISPEMLRACRFFDDYNYRVMMDPDTRVIIEDARNFLSLCDRKYDVIISQPSNPWISGISDLFTREFFELCRKTLADDGIMCAWLESYTIKEQDFRSVVRTFQSVFPETSIWSPMEWDFMLIGSKSKLTVDIDRMTGRLISPAIADDLSRIRVFSSVDLLGNLIMGGSGVRKLAEGVPIHTDDNVLLEFSSPATVVRNEGRWNLSRVLEKHREADFSFLTGADPELLKLVRQEASRRVWARGHVTRGSLLLDEGERKEAFAELASASSLSPGDRELRKVLRREVAEAGRLVRSGDMKKAMAMYSQVVELDSGIMNAEYGLGYVQEKLGRFTEAMESYAQAVKGDPKKIMYRTALAGVAYRLGRNDVVIEQYRKVLEIDPSSADVMNNLAWLLASTGGGNKDIIKEAISFSERACFLTRRRNMTMLDTLIRLYVLAGKKEEAIDVCNEALVIARANRNKKLEVQLRMAIEEMKK